MDDQEWFAEQLAQHRPRLRAVAYRLLGSLTEADDALQEAWLRTTRADPAAVVNPAAWLTTLGRPGVHRHAASPAGAP